MKTLVLANQKGGVGKSAIVVQLAYYAALKANKKVLVIDLDHQGNSSKALKLGGFSQLSHLNGSEVLTANKHAFEPFDEDKKILLVEANDALMKVDKRGESHNAFAGNFNHYLSTQAEYYDLCIIDTNPNPDIRMLSALVSTDYVLSPIQLNQEAIDGIGELLNNPTVGLNKIRKAINPNLTFLGLLPNLVEPTPFQKNNLKILSENFGKLLFKHEKGGFCAVKRSTAIPEAQALGSPLWLIPKTSARDSSKNLNRIFDTLLSVMELDNDND